MWPRVGPARPYARTRHAVRRVSSPWRAVQWRPVQQCPPGCQGRVGTEWRPVEGCWAVYVENPRGPNPGTQTGLVQKYVFRCRYVLWVHAYVLDRLGQSPGVLCTHMNRWCELGTLYSQPVTSGHPTLYHRRTGGCPYFDAVSKSKHVLMQHHCSGEVSRCVALLQGS